MLNGWCDDWWWRWLNDGWGWWWGREPQRKVSLSSCPVAHVAGLHETRWFRCRVVQKIILVHCDTTSRFHSSDLRITSTLQGVWSLVPRTTLTSPPWQETRQNELNAATTPYLPLFFKYWCSYRKEHYVVANSNTKRYERSRRPCIIPTFTISCCIRHKHTTINAPVSLTPARESLWPL